MESADSVLARSEHSSRRTDLSLQIPPRPICFSSNFNGKGSLHSLGSSRASSSTRSASRGSAFKNQVPMPNERSPLLNSDSTARIDLAIPESSSLASYIAALTWKRCVSLPVTPASHLSPSISNPCMEPSYDDHQLSSRHAAPSEVQRSLSVPMRHVVIMRPGSLSITKDLSVIGTMDDLMSPANLIDGDEEIEDQDACCRICFDELFGGGNTLKLECSCKGDLRLMHEDCAVKWFRGRSNNKCDVCGQEIRNLPVTLFRMLSSTENETMPHQISRNSNSQLTRAWQDVVVLILISTMCYFFFLEQLLVVQMNSQAIMIAAPFSFCLGLLSSLFAIVLASRQYVWAYSAFQFCLVVIFLHLYHTLGLIPFVMCLIGTTFIQPLSMVNLNQSMEITAVYAIVFAAFTGFGMSMSINSLFLLIFSWRAEVVQRQQTSSNPV